MIDICYNQIKVGSYGYEFDSSKGYGYKYTIRW